MAWLHKFISLLYISYLDCENTFKQVALITIGLVLGIFYFIYAVAYLPPEYTIYELTLISITLWNMSIILILLFQCILSLIFCVSVVKVGYIYDGGWSFVRKVKQQLIIDRQDRLRITKQHNEMISNMINQLKQEG
jgi:uncharacterized membrane protein YesL